MTVRELLNAKRFHKLCVINKHADLDRIIFTVESTETPDVSGYLSKQTLLITTGMVYKGNQNQLCNLIRELNQLSCAGLAIKLGRFIDHLDQQVIDLADQLQFPLIQIPMEYTLGEVFQKMLAYIWNDQNEELTYALNTQRKFSSLLLQGASLKVILNNIALAANRPAAILDPFGDIMEYTHTCTREHLKAAQGIFQKKSENFADYPMSNNVTLGRREEVVSVHRVCSIGNNPYYLYFFDSKLLHEEVSDLVIEQFSQVLGTYMFKNLHTRCTAIKQKESIFSILANQNKTEKWSASQLLMLGERYGLKAVQSYHILAGRLEQKKTHRFNFINLSHREERYMLIYDWLDAQVTKSFGGNVLLFPELNAYQFIFVIQGTNPGMEEEISRYHHKLLKLLQAEVTFAFGNSVTELISLDTAYNTALQSYENGEAESEQLYFIRRYAPKDARELLKMVSSEQSRSFCLNNLKKLAYPQEDMLVELRKTLKTYLDCKCSITETANTMFLHRNTVKYRIRKCKELLGRDFSDPAFCFQLQLGLVLSGDKQ